VRIILPAAFAALLALPIASSLFAADQPQAETSGTNATDSADTSGNATDASSNSADVTILKDQSKPLSDDSAEGAATPPAADVHRHRPGACPEGPPCKVGD
jgi:hypothetical protein